MKNNGKILFGPSGEGMGTMSEKQILYFERASNNTIIFILLFLFRRAVTLQFYQISVT